MELNQVLLDCLIIKNQLEIFIDEGINSTGILHGIFRINYNIRQWFFKVMIESINGVIAPESVDNVKTIMEKYLL